MPEVLYQSLREFLKANAFQDSKCMHSEVRIGERGQMKSDNQALLVTMDKFHNILQSVFR